MGKPLIKKNAQTFPEMRDECHRQAIHETEKATIRIESVTKKLLMITNKKDSVHMIVESDEDVLNVSRQLVNQKSSQCLS